ncbi:MAG: hypothetical protein KIT27_11835, partial [Legionellales bacterium]|nr:hypothetical protein [Legionellales bacterium]
SSSSSSSSSSSQNYNLQYSFWNTSSQLDHKVKHANYEDLSGIAHVTQEQIQLIEILADAYWCANKNANKISDNQIILLIELMLKTPISKMIEHCSSFNLTMSKLIQLKDFLQPALVAIKTPQATFAHSLAIKIHHDLTGNENGKSLFFCVVNFKRNHTFTENSLPLSQNFETRTMQGIKEWAKNLCDPSREVEMQQFNQPRT